MGIPALAGLPWLASVISAIVGSTLAFFAQYVTRRLALIVAVSSALAGVTIGFFVLIVSGINSMAAISPPELSQAMGLIYPDNFPLILSTVFTARIARWVYEWKVKVIHMRLS